MASFATLLSLAGERAPGPSPSYDRPHFLLAFLAIGDSGVIGRQALARQSGLGSGAVRTVIRKLREGGFAGANASGCFLTRPGEQVYAAIRQELTPPLVVGGSQLTAGSVQVAFAVRGASRRVKGGIEQRDSAVRAGAAGATTYVIRSGRFAVPGGSQDCEREFPGKAWKSLRAGLNPGEGDAVILCGSSDAIGAMVGALSAALTLL